MRAEFEQLYCRVDVTLAVITSYSIHYTKLYEFGAMSMDEGNMSATKYDATPQTVCQQLGPADEKNGGSSSCCGTASTETVKPSTGFAVGTGRSMSGLPIAVRPAQPDDFSVILSLLAASKFRITSYNVCYTKLLRT